MPKLNDIRCVVVESEKEIDPHQFDAALGILCRLLLREYYRRHPELTCPQEFLPLIPDTPSPKP